MVFDGFRRRRTPRSQGVGQFFGSTGMPEQRREVYYRGHVQGVGFRFTARQIAAQHQVTGFVRNTPDGRVHLVAEGSAAQLDRFLADIASQMSAYIREAVVDERPAVGEFRGFEIRHC